MKMGDRDILMNNAAASCRASKAQGNNAGFGKYLPGIFHKKGVLAFLVIVIVGIISTGSSHARVKDMPFPTYGAGAIHVWIYTDYFCPPCRAMEPALELILKDLVKRKIITLTLVDTPFKPYSSLYARYFLYALNSKNQFIHALRVRSVLFDAAKSEQFSTKESINALFKNKKIPFAVFDPTPVFDRFKTLVMEDKIRSTPTCVIVRGGEKEHVIGGQDIINALKAIQ